MHTVGSIRRQLITPEQQITWSRTASVSSLCQSRPPHSLCPFPTFLINSCLSSSLLHAIQTPSSQCCLENWALVLRRDPGAAVQCLTFLQWRLVGAQAEFGSLSCHHPARTCSSGHNQRLKWYEIRCKVCQVSRVLLLTLELPQQPLNFC